MKKRIGLLLVLSMVFSLQVACGGGLRKENQKLRHQISEQQNTLKKLYDQKVQLANQVVSLQKENKTFQTKLDAVKKKATQTAKNLIELQTK